MTGARLWETNRVFGDLSEVFLANDGVHFAVVHHSTPSHGWIQTPEFPVQDPFAALSSTNKAERIGRCLPPPAQILEKINDNPAIEFFRRGVLIKSSTIGDLHLDSGRLHTAQSPMDYRRCGETQEAGGPMKSLINFCYTRLARAAWDWTSLPKPSFSTNPLLLDGDMLLAVAGESFLLFGYTTGQQVGTATKEQLDRVSIFGNSPSSGSPAGITASEVLAILRKQLKAANSSTTAPRINPLGRPGVQEAQ